MPLYNSAGITPHTRPAVYHGVALMVVRDDYGDAVVAFDANGEAVYLGDEMYLEAVDVPAPITDEDVRHAIAKVDPE